MGSKVTNEMKYMGKRWGLGCRNDTGLRRARLYWSLITSYASKTLIKSRD